MKTFHRFSRMGLSLLLLPAFLLSIAGCSDEFGIIDPSKSQKLTGEYVRVLLSASRSSTGTVNFETDGTVNLNETISTPDKSEQAGARSGSRTEDSDGNFVIDYDSIVIKGAVTDNGVAYSGVRLNDTADKFIVAGVRPPPSGFSNSTISGEFHFALLSFKNGVPNSSHGIITFNDSGKYTIDGRKSDTTSAGNTYNESGIYTITYNGRLTLTRGDSYVYDGAISATGDIIVAGGVKDTDEQSAIVCLRKDTGWTVDNASGIYRSSTLQTDGSGTTTSLVSTVFNGLGDSSYEGATTTGANLETPVSDSGNYTVADDGSYTVTYGARTIYGAFRGNGKISVTSQENTVEHLLGVYIQR